jgi:hypothetical protein
MTPADLLDLVIDRAPRLRASGVRCVQIDGLRVELDPVEVAPVFQTISLGSEPEEQDIDPLFDPATYGRKSGTPGFDISDESTSDDGHE